jgi:hypothetical protein
MPNDAERADSAPFGIPSRSRGAAGVGDGKGEREG